MARSRQYPPSVDPGVPTEQPVPEGWQRFTFGELLDVVERPVVLDDNRIYQLVNAKRSRGGITPRDRLPGRDIRVKSQFEIEAGDFLISKRQIIHGACGVVPKELTGAVVSNEYVALRPRESLDINYLRHLSFTSYFQRTCFHSSVGVDVEKMVFKLDQWFCYPVSLPPLDEQKKIAAILSLVDEAIDKTQAVVDQLELVKYNVLRELLTQGVASAGAAHWKIMSLADVANCFSGGTPSRARPTFFGGGIPWIKSGECNQRRITSSEETLTQAGLDASSARWVPPGSVLVAMYGATAGKVARLEIQATINQAICAVVPNVECVSGAFLFWSITAAAPELIRRAQGSGQPNLSGNLIKTLKLRIPSLKEQATIAATLDAIEAAEQVSLQEIEQLQVLRKGLVESLLSGKVSVSAPTQEAA